MRYLSKHQSTELSAGSMADIAFLLLTFYMVTTVIRDEKGIALLLPQYDSPTAPVHERNLFTIQINSADQFLIEGELRPNTLGLKDEIKKFILNNSADPHQSVSSDKAVVSLKTDRGTSYRTFIQTLDEIQTAYYEIYAAQAGVTPERFRKLDLAIATEKQLYEKDRKGIPMNISIAEPTRTK